MRPRSYAVFALAAIAAAPAAGQNAGTRCTSSPPAATPFAPALSDSSRIFRGAFSPDGGTFYFFKHVGSDRGREDYRIFTARRRDGWATAEPLMLGEEHSDLYPAPSADGRRLVFASYRPAPGDTASHPNAGLWYVDRQGERWGVPVFIHEATEPGSYHSQPYLGPAGRLYFRRTTPDWRTTRSLISVWDGSQYGRPELDAAIERWRDWRPDWYVWGGIPASDGSYLLLEVSAVDTVTGRRAPSGIWVTFLEEPDWTEPRPLEAGVNVPGTSSNFMTLTPDGCDLVFVRDFTAFERVALGAALGPRPRRRGAAPAPAPFGQPRSLGPGPARFRPR